MAPLVVVRSTKAAGITRIRQLIQGFLDSAEQVEQALDLTVTNRERLCVTAPDVIAKLKVLVKEVVASSATGGNRASGKSQGQPKAESKPSVKNASSSPNKKKRPREDEVDDAASQQKVGDGAKTAEKSKEKSKKAKKERRES